MDRKLRTKTTFINDFFRLVPVVVVGFLLAILWIIIIVQPNVVVISLTAISTCCWLVAFVYLIYTGRLTKIIIYSDKITWHRHFKTRTIYLDDIKIENIIPVRHHQWCMLIINDEKNILHMGLCNSRHMTRMIRVLQPSKFTEVVKEEKKKCEEWRFNSSW
ncbi:MAG: hypothetical protein K2O04_02520 [Clostridiales bacterium]|nr:hypothetical protein [Clostridiales bacterium]